MAKTHWWVVYDEARKECFCFTMVPAKKQARKWAKALSEEQNRKLKVRKVVLV